MPSIVQGKLMDGKVIDSSLSMEPLVVELGKRTVIAGKLTADLDEILSVPLTFCSLLCACACCGLTFNV